VHIVGDNSIVGFEGNSTVPFNSNRADTNGGALYVDCNCTVRYKEKSTIVFDNNSADLGGTIFIKYSQICIEGNSR